MNDAIYNNSSNYLFIYLFFGEKKNVYITSTPAHKCTQCTRLYWCKLNSPVAEVASQKSSLWLVFSQAQTWRKKPAFWPTGFESQGWQWGVGVQRAYPPGWLVHQHPQNVHACRSEGWTALLPSLPPRAKTTELFSPIGSKGSKVSQYLLCPEYVSQICKDIRPHIINP